MNALVITLLCLFIVACSSTDISKVSPFSSVSNQSVPIVRTTYLKPLNEGLILGEGISFLRKTSFELTNHKPDGAHRTLTPGTSLQIISIRDELLIDGLSQVAYGTTVLSDGTEVDFAYRWGFISTIVRAPWEPISVPERREWRQGEHGSAHQSTTTP